MVKALLFFQSHLLGHLLSCFHLLLVQIHFLPVPSVLLLLLYQMLDHSCLRLVLVGLHVEEFFLLLLFILCVTDFLLDLHIVVSLLLQDLLSLLLFLSLVHQSHLSFFLHLHLQPELLFSVSLHISLSLGNDISSLLSSLVNLLEGANLLLLEQ